MFKKFSVKSISVLLVLCILLSMSGCNSNKEKDEDKPSLSSSISSSITFESTSDVSKDPKFDSVVLSLTADDFTNEGIEFGDSCDIVFSNGLTFTDVPYYNGYYVKTGELVIVAYPKNQYVLIARNNRDFYSSEGLSDDMTVEIILNTKAAYLATYEALGQDYSVDRTDYDSDEQFANFRAMTGGNLKEDFLYRGASPVDNSRKRARYADSLLEKYQIVTVIDLADSEDDLQSYQQSNDFLSYYTMSLYENGKVVLLDMGANYDSDEYKESVAKGMRHLISNGGPAYIHCMEGKDRTGFICLLLEALAGSSYEEMCNDYMTTYANYYKITKEGTPEKYDAVVALYFDAFMEYLYGSTDIEELKNADYSESAKNYLTSCGLTSEEIEQLVTLICK